MILHKETHSKFGYWPDDLSTHSNKPILCKCIKCGKVRQTAKTNLNRSRFYGSRKGKSVTGMCLQCNLVVTGKQRAAQERVRARERHRDYWENKPAAKIDIKYACFLLHHTLMGNVKSAAKKGAVLLPFISNHAFKRKIGPWKSLNQEETVAVLKGLGFRDHPKNTAEYKNGIFEYIKRQSIENKFAVVNDLICKSSRRVNISTMGVSISHGKWKKFLSLVPIEFKPAIKYRNSNKDGRIRDPQIIITKGSFFIDGRWIHIG